MVQGERFRTVNAATSIAVVDVVVRIAVPNNMCDCLAIYRASTTAAKQKKIGSSYPDRSNRRSD